jgi:hypothetical protein
VKVIMVYTRFMCKTRFMCQAVSATMPSFQKWISPILVSNQFSVKQRYFSSSETSSLDDESPLDKIHDVTGGKIGEEKPEEGKLFIAERAKNLLIANSRFQLSTYNRLPEDQSDAQSVHTSARYPVQGAFHKSSGRPVIFLRRNIESEIKHIENVSRLSSASIVTGHIDPPPLIPVFTRLGLKPPTVLLVGDLMEVESPSEVQSLIPEALKAADVVPFWFEWSGIHFIDVFDKKQAVAARDFRACFVDYLAHDQHQAIHLINTKYFDFLPSLCQGFMGVPVTDAYFYSVDRIGMSIFALRADSENEWREYRFPFTKFVNIFLVVHG